MRNKLGYMFMVLGIIFLVIFLILPSVITDNSFFNQFLGLTFCGDPSAYQNDSYTSSFRSETSAVIKATCRKPDGAIEDITARQNLVSMSTFFSSLIIGVILVSTSETNRGKKKRASRR